MQLVLQILLQGITDRTLAVCAANIQWDFVHPLGLRRDLGTPQDKSNLRAISMPDHDLITGLDHIGDVNAGFRGGKILIFNALVLGVLDQGVPANSNNSNLLCHSLLLYPIVKAMTAFWACRRFSA